MSTPNNLPSTDVPLTAQQAEFAEAMEESHMFPNLMEPDVLLDTQRREVFPPNKHTKFTNSVTVRNDTSIFRMAMEVEKEERGGEEMVVDELDSADTHQATKYLHIPPNELTKLYRAQIIRFVKQQTGKGKIERVSVLMVVGNGRGLLGLGEGKGPDLRAAINKAFPEAVRNMDYVDRFEDRTVWTDMESKFCSTHIIVRPRPVGFGLAVNPVIHEVFKVAGIKDASAKVWGSRNKYQVMKAIVRMLLPGREPAFMGNGMGRKGRRLEKGLDMRSAMELERDRGRRIVPLHT